VMLSFCGLLLSLRRCLRCRRVENDRRCYWTQSTRSNGL